MNRLIAFFQCRFFFWLFTALVLLHLITACTCKTCREKYDPIICEICCTKADELTRKASSYALQTDNLILDYQTFIQGYKQSYGHTCDSVDVYIDRTKGMEVMINTLGRDNTWTDLINSIRGSKTNWFEVYGSGAPEDYIKALPGPPPFDELVRVDYYQEYGSPLDSAFSKIVRTKNRQSIFITDGELARDGETFLRADGRRTIINPKEAWAKDMIAAWLKEGNVIDILIRPYYRPTAQDTMRGFIFIFTPASMVNEPGNITNRILNNLSIKNRDNLYHLHFGFYDHYMSRINPVAESARSFINTNFTDRFGQNIFIRHANPKKRFEHFHFNLPVNDFRKFFYTWINMKHDRATREPIETHTLFNNLGFANNSLVFDTAKLGIRVYNLDKSLEEFTLMKKTEWADTVMTEQWGAIYCIDNFNFPNERPEIGLTPLSPFQNLFSLKHNSQVSQSDILYQKYSVNSFSPTEFNFSDFSGSNSFRIDFVVEDFSAIGNNPLLNQLKWNNHIFSDPLNDGVYKSFLFAFTENQEFIKKKPVYTIYLTFN